MITSRRGYVVCFLVCLEIWGSRLDFIKFNVSEVQYYKFSHANTLNPYIESLVRAVASILNCWAWVRRDYNFLKQQFGRIILKPWRLREERVNRQNITHLGCIVIVSWEYHCTEGWDVRDKGWYLKEVIIIINLIEF